MLTYNCMTIISVWPFLSFAAVYSLHYFFTETAIMTAMMARMTKSIKSKMHFFLRAFLWKHNTLFIKISSCQYCILYTVLPLYNANIGTIFWLYAGWHYGEGGDLSLWELININSDTYWVFSLILFIVIQKSTVGPINIVLFRAL